MPSDLFGDLFALRGGFSPGLRWFDVSFARAKEHGTVLLGKYRLDGVIGRGAIGVVVKAWHLGLEEPIAIKVLRDDIPVAEETIARFVREAQAAARLKGEHIARITDVGLFEDGKPYMLMELLEGQDLGQLIAERGRLSPSLAIDLVIQACVALAEAHSIGIVHRDIKPTNLFLTSRPDGSLLLKVLDFGISKAPSDGELALTQTWSLLGSPAYMSPEQMRSAHDVDGRTDIWSLGAVLYEALEGRLPFAASSFSEMCVKVAVDVPTPMTAAPPELAAIALRCLAKNPDERYANVAELGRDLARIAREPDAAQVLVDRMVRMLGRTANHRTPYAGVPLVGFALPETASPPALAPAFTPAFTPPLSASTIARHSRPPTAPPFVPVAMPGAASPFVPAAMRGAAPPFVPVAVPGAASRQPVPPPRPDTHLSRGTPRTVAVSEPARRAGREPDRRPARVPDRGWIVSVVAAVVAIAAAVAIVTTLGRDPAPSPQQEDGPPVVRMTPVEAPAPAPPRAGAGTAAQ